jgi:ubiquinone/menaquinone biosynthesis C-methylase UbiE
LHSDLLEWAKERVWFYEFQLPDGSVTRTDIPPAVLEIHRTRQRHLERLISSRVDDPSRLSALDLASHEGYYSFVLAKHFAQVVGVEQRAESIDSATKMQQLLGVSNVRFQHASVEHLEVAQAADFVLMFGLLYHVQDPIGILQRAAELSRKFLCIETQVLPFDACGLVENGHYLWTRPLQGLFGLVADNPERREGGQTRVAMVPTINALTWLLGQLGFSEVVVVPPEASDYEQFLRRQRVIVFTRR